MTNRNGALPVPDFDLLPAGSLPSRIRQLDIEQVEQLIGYERNHGERPRVLDLLEHRRDQIRTTEDRSVDVDVHDA
ncbi:hypothetical protein [Kribbella sp. NPDC004875]|uniref:hypothetical protein n=1 Tax=Kribbella sp. NPDC004875 TaxID=3364107 RepID=UPI0036A3B4BE